MSGYAEGILVLLSINVVLGYAAFLPMAAGQLNLGVGPRFLAGTGLTRRADGGQRHKGRE